MPPLVPPGRWSRRQALLAGALALLAGGGATGCGVDLGAVRRDDVPPPTPPEPGPDDLARVAAVRTAIELRGDLASATSARPDLAPLLTRLAADHDAHLAQLGPLPPDDPAGAPADPSGGPAGGSTGGPSGSASATAGPTGPAGPPPADPARLAGAETAGAAQALAAVATTSGPLARLLTGVAAARSAHAVELAAALGLPAPAAPTTSLGAAGTVDSPSAPAVEQATASGAAGAALLALVDGEHAVAYAYGVLAVRLRDEPRAAAVRSIDRHQTAARRLAAVATAAGLSPRPAEVAYPVPPVPDAAAATGLAADLELRLATAAATLVGTSEGDLRLLAADVAVARTLAALAWRAPVPALPGLGEPPP